MELRSRLVKTEKVMVFKVGIKRDLITTSRRVLNTPEQEFVARERLTARYRLFIMLRIHIHRVTYKNN